MTAEEWAYVVPFLGIRQRPLDGFGSESKQLAGGLAHLCKEHGSGSLGTLF